MPKDPEAPATTQEIKEPTFADVMQELSPETPAEDVPAPAPAKKQEPVDDEGEIDESEEEVKAEPKKEPVPDELPDPDELDKIDEDETEEVPQLDPELVSKLDPKDLERWNNHWKGANKVKKQNAEAATQLAERETKVKETESELEGFRTFANDLFSTNTADAQRAFAHLKARAKETGVPLSQLLGEAPAKPDTVIPEGHTWESEGEKLLAGKNSALEQAMAAQAAELAAIKEQLKNPLAPEVASELKALKEQREAQAKQAEFNSLIDEVTPRTIKRMEKVYPGFPVSKEMVIQAHKLLPEIAKDNPAKAVAMAFQSDLLKWDRQRRKEDKPGPNLAPTAQSKGQRANPKPADEVTFLDVLQEINSS